MGLFDKVGSFIKREAEDLEEAAESMKEKLDSELTRREEELAMTPSEKIAALQEQAALTDDKLDAIAGKALGQQAQADAVAEVAEIGADELPNVTHVVISEDGEELQVPVVEAPTPEDLKKDIPVFPDLPHLRDESAASTPGTSASPATTTATVAAAADAAEAAAASRPTPESVYEIQEAVTHDQAFPDGQLPPPPGRAHSVTPPTAPAPEPEVAAAPVADTPAPVIEPAATAEAQSAPAPAANYNKTPAQIKYEQARAAADDLLKELRGELKDEGEI